MILIEFNDPGVTVIDSIDGNLVATVTGSVDVNTVGTYILKYGATDTSGNTATEVQRIVTVGDTGAPVILLVGNILGDSRGQDHICRCRSDGERHAGR